MAAKTTQIDIKIAGDASGASAAFAKSAADFEAFKKRVKTEGLASNGSSGILGNVAGAAGQLQTLAEGAKEFATALRTGQSAGEALGGVLNKIPIVGQLKQAGDAIRELIIGEKAAQVETQKIVDAATRLADTYRAINNAASMRGLHGDAKDYQSLINSLNGDVIGFNKEVEGTQNKMDQIKLTGLGGWSHVAHWMNLADDEGLTEAQQAEIKRLELQVKASQLGREQAGKTREVTLADQREAIAHSHDEELRHMILETDAFEASVQEKALRRQGKGVESASVAIREKLKADLSELQESISPFAIKQKGFTADTIGFTQKEAFLAASRNKQVGLVHAAEVALADLQAAEDFKRMEKVRETENTILHIKAEAHEKQLQALGLVHDAERARIAEESREAIAAAEKQYREEHRANSAPTGDPGIEGTTRAAAERSAAQVGLITMEEKKQAMEKYGAAQREIDRLNLQTLREQASLGDEAQMRAVKELEISEKYRQNREAIAKLMAGELSMAQRAKLIALGEQSTANEAAERKRALASGGGSTGGQYENFAGLEEAGYRTMFGMAPDVPKATDAEKNAEATAKNTAATTANLEALNQLMKLAFGNTFTGAGLQ